MKRMIRSFVPHTVCAPAMQVVRVTEDMQVSGRVRLPKGDAFGVMRGGVTCAPFRCCFPKKINPVK